MQPPAISLAEDPDFSRNAPAVRTDDERVSVEREALAKLFAGHRLGESQFLAELQADGLTLRTREGAESAA